jgi:hypothetical protein
MREYRKAISEASKRKLDSIEKGEPHTKVDSSSWSPPPMLEADKQNGMRPVSPRQYKSGGKVHGEHSKKRADRKARKEGGRAMSVDGFINRDNKMANDERAGVKKIGGMKRGGKIKREHHADGDAVGNMIRQTEIEENMKNRGIPARVPLPPRRPVEPPVKYTGPRNPVADRMGPKHGGKIPAKHAKGGVVEHSDEAQDKKLMHKVLKPKAFKADGGAMHHEDCSCKMCSGGRTMKKAGGGLYANIHAKQERIAHGSKEHMRKPGSKGAPTADAFKQSAKTAKAVGGRNKHADGGEAGRGLYVREGYPHEVPGANGGRTARKHGGATKGKTNINIMIHPHGTQGGMPPAMPPMGGPMMPPPPPPRPPMPPMGAMGAGAPMPPPMGAVGAGMPPMGAARPGMPPIGRKSGGKVEHVIDHAAGGGLGRLEKIKAYGLK